MIPYGRQSISQEDIEAVLDVLKSDFLTQGPQIQNFENQVAKLCKARFAVAFSSATAALHIACLAQGIEPGKRVWTSPNSFVASANCALYCGAEIDFVDIDPETLNMSIEALERKLREAKSIGCLPDLVIPVHFAGFSCAMEEIGLLSKKYDFNVIEDASHALGGSYQGKSVGDCRFSNCVVFSFHPVKIATSAEGGVVVTNDETLYQKMQLFRTHGITRDGSLMKSTSEGPWYYQQIELGYNYRLSDLHAALGASQIRRLRGFIDRRNELAERYDSALTDLPLEVPRRDENVRSAFHLYVIRLHDSSRRRDVFDFLRSTGIGVNVHYIPIHTQPYFQKLGFRKGDFPRAEAYYERAITIPLFPGMSEEDQDAVVSSLKKILN